MRPLLLLSPLLALACARPSESAPTKPTASETVDPAITRVTALAPRLQSFASAQKGTVAISVVHVRTGARAAVHGDLRLPMMSVFKLPLALVTLAAVDAGLHRLDEKVPIVEREIRSFVSPIAEAWKQGDTAPSLETMLVRVLQDSDNTAGDKLVSFNGGGAAITAKLRAMGIDGVDVAEEEIDIFARELCGDAPRPVDGWSEAALKACPKTSDAAQLAAAKREVTIPPNAATADALSRMLVRVAAGDGLSKASHVFLLRTLEGTKTGPSRLKGLLPPGTVVAHKTGTGSTVGGFNVATNDIGLISLPGGEKVAVAVLTSGLPGDGAARDRVIAEAAKLVWDALVTG